MSEIRSSVIARVWTGTQAEFDAGTDEKLLEALGLAGSVAITEDGNEYESDGDSWNPSGTNGAASSSSILAEYDDQGDIVHPSQYAHTFTYNGDDTVNTDSFGDGTFTWTRTYGYDTGKVITKSVWARTTD